MPETVGYRITHRTRYRYSEPVALCQNQVRMQPRTRSGLTCHQTTVSVKPRPDGDEVHEDYFGNRVHTFAIESLHRELEVTVKSDVAVTARPPSSQAASEKWEAIADRFGRRYDLPLLPEQEFCHDSPRISRAALFADYASQSFTAGRGIVEAVRELTQRINADFRYDTSATDVSTPTERSFELRAGVCQDFAHIEIACLRSLGFPARYVSGYLRTIPPPGKPKLVGVDESHAWLSVYCGETLGWIDCDPTNACLTGTDHIPVCVGRDYGDVSPMRGVVLGGGKPILEVSVDVQPQDDSEA